MEDFILQELYKLIVYLTPKLVNILKETSSYSFIKIHALFLYIFNNKDMVKSFLGALIQFFFKILKVIYNAKNLINKEFFEFFAVFFNINTKFDKEINELIIALNNKNGSQPLAPKDLSNFTNTIVEYSDTFQSLMKNEINKLNQMNQPNESHEEIFSAKINFSNKTNSPQQSNLSAPKYIKINGISKNYKKDLKEWLEFKYKDDQCSKISLNEKKELATMTGSSVFQIDNWIKYQKKKARCENNKA